MRRPATCWAALSPRNTPNLSDVDIWLTLVWVAYLAIFLGTIIKRKEPHIYVANWFFLSFIVTVAMLHIVNKISIPVSIYGSKSVQLFAGV